MKIELRGTDDALQIRKSGESVSKVEIVDLADEETKNKAHRDGAQLIPERGLGTFNTQFNGAIIEDVSIHDCNIRSDGKLQCIFCSDGMVVNGRFENNTLDTNGRHFISLSLLSGTIRNNRDSAGNLAPIRLFPVRMGGNSDGTYNVYVLTFKQDKYNYKPVDEIVKDDTLDHVTDHRFGFGKRENSIYLYDFDLDGYVAEVEKKQLTANQMRELALNFGSQIEPEKTGGNLAKDCNAPDVVYENSTRPVTQNKKESKPMNSNELTQWAAEKLSIEQELIEALLLQESKKKAFYKSNPIILFERTHYTRRLASAGYDLSEVVRNYPATSDLISYEAMRKYGSYSKQWERFINASAVDQNVAIESCSWGKFQIMGFHWLALGYNSPLEFKDAMNSEEGQFMAFVEFMKNDGECADALRRRDWNTFKKLYNGTGKNNYAAELAQNYRRVLASKAPSKSLMPFRDSSTGSRTVNAQGADIAVKASTGVGGVVGVDYAVGQVNSILAELETKTQSIEDAKVRVLEVTDKVKDLTGQITGIQAELDSFDWMPWAIGLLFILWMLPNFRSIYTYMQDNGYLNILKRL